MFSSLLTAALEQNLRITNIRYSECIYLFWHFVRTRLQNSPYFCVLQYAREAKEKVWNEAENRDPVWGETLKIFFSRLTPCEARALRARKSLTPRFTDFFTDFEKKKPTVLQSTLERAVTVSQFQHG